MGSDQLGVIAQRHEIQVGHRPVALRLFEPRRIITQLRRRETLNVTGLLQHDDGRSAVEHVDVVALGLILGQHALRQGLGIGAMIFDLDVRIFFLEGFLDRLERLVDDQGRIPQELAFLFGTLFKQGLAVGRLRQSDFLHGGACGRIRCDKP